MAKQRQRSLDMQRIASALAGPGMDPRLWVSYGTVSTGAITSGPDDDQQTFDVTDPHAVAISAAGVAVDVVLEPSMQLVTCHYAGVQGGMDCVVLAPIFVGDRVLVVMPDGTLGGSGPPVIVAILNSDSEQIPLGPDRKPLFQNDRVLIWAKEVPIDIRTEGGSRIQVNEDGTVIVNEGTKGVARIQDQVQVPLSGLPIATDGIYALATSLLLTGLFVASPSPPVPPPDVPDVTTNGTITSASETVRAGD